MPSRKPTRQWEEVGGPELKRVWCIQPLLESGVDLVLDSLCQADPGLHGSRLQAWASGPSSLSWTLQRAVMATPIWNLSRARHRPSCSPHQERGAVGLQGVGSARQLH